jgi:hypothetical protein
VVTSDRIIPVVHDGSLMSAESPRCDPRVEAPPLHAHDAFYH